MIVICESILVAIDMPTYGNSILLGKVVATLMYLRGRKATGIGTCKWACSPKLKAKGRANA